jgi:hypothetical protein
VDTAEVVAIAKAAGCLDAAGEDVLHRVRTHFGAITPSLEEVTAYVRGDLHQVAPHCWPVVATAADAAARGGAPPEIWAKMSLEDRLSRYRQANPPVVEKRRPVSRDLTTKELASLEGLSWVEKITKARVMQQTPPPAGA